MSKIEIKHKLTDAVLYTYEADNATIKDAVEKAVKENADLYGADLRGAYLRGANLRGAYLSGADLSGAKMKFGVIKEIFQVSNIGSRNDVTTIYHTEQSILIKCGCFEGTIEEFEAKVKETHQGNEFEKQYLALIELVKIRFNK